MFSKITVHRVGNKINGESLTLSQEELQLEEDMKELLGNYFMSAFKSEEQFQFYSDSYLVNNPVYSSVSEIFEDKAKFQWESENIAKHLFNAAENPRVQAGELFIVYFEGEPIETEDGEPKQIDSIGIFKTEKRESFLKIFPKNETFDVERDHGISLSKIDKAALIYNNDKESGYILSVVDNNKNGDMYYWFEDFLNKSINFFKEKEEFKYDDFVNEVLQDESVIESFSNFKSDYEQDMQISISEDFPINNQAVKKQQRHFKSIIKLDKNFHIYIHGDRKMIETGQDDKGKFYRLYFEQEK